MKAAIVDSLGRSFQKLRIGLTPECNFACVYCVSSNSKLPLPREVILENHDYIAIVSSLVKLLDTQEIKLTGGEPTLYKDLTSLIFKLKKIVPKVSLTTNGYLLGRLVPSLKEVGIDSVNVSLDSLDEEIFSIMSRGRNRAKTLESIDLLEKYNIPFKFNTTVLRGYNEGNIISLLEFAGRKQVPIRFIEYMKMGELATYNSFSKWFYSKAEILAQIQEKYKVVPIQASYSSTAEYWRTTEGFVFGIIANESSPFCKTCDRLRLDYRGNLYGYLSSPFSFPILKEHTDLTALKKTIQKALALKQKEKFTGSNVVMRHIGG